MLVIISIHLHSPQISFEGFFPKPGADYSSTSSSNPDKTFIFVNNRPIHHKDIMKVGSFWTIQKRALHPGNSFLIPHSYPVTLIYVSLFFFPFQLLRQHYIAQYPNDGARNRYPILTLSITVSPSSVDVNLTPDKTQVLLHDKVCCKVLVVYSGGK